MMSETRPDRDEVALRAVVPALEAEGFEVFLHPPRTMLPAFMGGYQPDAIARKGDKNLAIEVMSDRLPKGAKRRWLADLFSGQPDWEVRLVYTPRPTPEELVSEPSPEAVVGGSNRILDILKTSGEVPALLYAWSVLEAAVRLLTPGALGKPKTPAHIVETLASNGYVPPDEADVLRSLASRRNDAAHGGLEVKASAEELSRLVEIIQTLLTLRSSGTPERQRS